MTRVCSECMRRKPLTAFTRHTQRSNGRSSRCRACAVRREMARQEARIAAGLCRRCGAPLFSLNHCLRCLRLVRVAVRARYGHRSQAQAGTGRLPLESTRRTP